MAAHTTSFGGQVRSLRVAAGLTQAELAERSGISERTISDLERGVRATAYSSTARRLASALQVTEGDAASFFAHARASDRKGIRLAEDPPPVASAARFRLPIPLTRLVDREVELALLLELVRDPEQRLVTLLGSGGIGKT
ncbi:MAG: helix-turn-helix domain-containing protein, partial [Actinomycetota bacterium]|nr:helix-turn-helix domain-containing protein [Actinomycetota bacterium]